MPAKTWRLQPAVRPVKRQGLKKRGSYKLGHIDYSKSGKKVYAFAGPAPADAAPSCASWEVDQAALRAACPSTHTFASGAVPFLDRLTELLKQ